MTTANLGFSIDSSQAVKATTDLDKMAAASKKAEAAASSLSGQQGAVAAAAKRAGVSYEEQAAKVTKANSILIPGQAAAAKGAASLTTETKNLTKETDGAEKSASNFANTLTRRLVLGYVATQVKNLAQNVANLNAELANTGDTGRFSGVGGQAVQGIQSSAALKGIDASAMSNALLAFSAQLPLAKAGIGELGELLRANKITVTDSADAFFKVADLVARTRNDEEKISILRQAGLPATAAMARYLEQGSESLRKQVADAPKFTDAQVRAARELDEKFNATWESIRRKGEEALVALQDFPKPDTPLAKFLEMSRGDKPWSVKFDVEFGVVPGSIADIVLSWANGVKPTQINIPINTKAESLPGYPVVPVTSAPLGPAGPDTINEVARKAKEADRISRAQQALSIYGQMTNAAEAVEAVELQAATLRNARIPIDEKRLELLKKITYETNIGVTAVKASTDAYNVEAATVGMNTGEAAKFTAIQNELNKSIREGSDNFNLNTEAGRKNYAMLVDNAQKLGDAAKAAEDGKFSLDTFKGGVSTFVSELRNGTNVWESFGKAGQSALNKIADKLMDMALNNLWKAAFPGGGGFLSLLGLGGGGGGGVSPGNIGGTGGGLGGLFADGGWTGSGGNNQIAGLVHANEFVVKAGPAQRNLALLEGINRGLPGYAAGGLVAPLTMYRNPDVYSGSPGGFGEVLQ